MIKLKSNPNYDFKKDILMIVLAIRFGQIEEKAKTGGEEWVLEYQM